MTAPVAVSERRTIPFDYAFRFDLVGELGRQHSSAVRLSVESSFVAVAIGYGFIPRRDPLRFGPGRIEDLELDPATVQAFVAALPPVQPPRQPRDVLALAIATLPAGLVAMQPPAPIRANVTVSWPPRLSDFRLSWVANALRRAIREQAPTSQSQPRFVRQRAADLTEVLARGIRFNPSALESIMARGDNAPLDVNDLEQLFEEIPPNEEPIQFLYRLIDEGTGREFQSDPILSTAGLGIHDGDRPFRQFAVPIVFDRLSTIRMDVFEKSTFPCELHVSLQGYRVLGESGTPTDPRRMR